MKKEYATISNNKLILENDETLNGERCSLSIDFVRTLRIPDDNKKYNLPPGLGSFPLKHVEDYKNVPSNWQEHGGIFLPMHQSEAMWLKFNSAWPFAIKIAAGKINAVSGEAWEPELKKLTKEIRETAFSHEEENYQNFNFNGNNDAFFKENPNNNPKYDYVVSPRQPWLDGFNVGKGLIRQFVAMPLHEGYTVEEQLTGKAEHGGIQIIAYPMKKEHYEKIVKERSKARSIYLEGAMITACATNAPSPMGALRSKSAEMGLGAGGFMKQEIYEDPYGLDAWDMTKPIKVFVHLLNSKQYKNVTNQEPPTAPLSPDVYKSYHYPWFDYYSDNKALEGSSVLSKVDSVASIAVKKDEPINNGGFEQPKPYIIGKKTVKNGNW